MGPPESIADLAGAIAEADYESILKVADAFASEGIDLYRALLDLQEYVREGLVSSIRGEVEKLDLSSEQFTRILDALRAGEESVRSGLSDKANFEVTLFRAVEAARSRAIDTVIREISGMVPPEESKKKTETVASPSSPSHQREDVSADDSLPEPENEEEDDDSTPAMVEEDPVPEAVDQEPVVSSEPVVEPVNSPQTPRELPVVDEKLIAERVEALPESTRKILDEDFRARYVAIEKIDREKLL